MLVIMLPNFRESHTQENSLNWQNSTANNWWSLDLDLFFFPFIFETNLTSGTFIWGKINNARSSHNLKTKIHTPMKRTALSISSPYIRERRAKIMLRLYDKAGKF